MLSLIITVKNEKENLPKWLESIVRQTKQPDEIIIVDGGSDDGSWEWLQTTASPSVKIFQKKGNIASGRNYAISRALGEIIAVTDAGCVYQQNWLQELLAPLEKKQAKFTSTAFYPWLENQDKLLFYLLAAATIPAQKEFKKDWLPSSRSTAFLKELWQSAGGYPEWLPYCEDIIFDFKLIKNGFKPFLIREPLVAWRPRPTLRAYFRQLYNYTRSDGHGKLFYGRQFIRYGAYIGLVVLLILATQNSLWWLWLLGLSGVVYMLKFWRRFWQFSNSKKIPARLAGLIAMPFIIVWGDLAKMAGWLTGVGERWSGKIKYQNL